MSPVPDSNNKFKNTEVTGIVQNLSLQKGVNMLKFYTTLNRQRIEEIDKPEAGCWISAIAPTPEEIAYLKNEIGVLPEFIKASLDEEESAHIDKDDDQTLIVIDYPSQEESITDDEETLVYMTLPMGVVFIKDYIVTISLYDNMTNEEIRAMLQ